MVKTPGIKFLRKALYINYENKVGGTQMKWEDVRKQYPNTFVKFEIVESHIEEDKEIVDEVAFIKAIKDGKEAMVEHLRCKDGQYVYSTIKERVEIQLVKYIGIRGRM